MVPTTDYINTIAPENEPEFPGDEEIERRYRAWIRWNAAVTVHRAQRPGIGVGGHISTYASSAALYEVGFNHFFRGHDHPAGGDQIFIQGHASPGTYARAFLEGRLTEAQLDGFRQEKSQRPTASPRTRTRVSCRSSGSSRPSRWVSARSTRSTRRCRTSTSTNRGIKDVSDAHVWAFLGDGEMDEVESRGQLQVAANEGLDNLTFVINCNLQRLDGPVRGNGKIIQELESFFRGAGWNVIKVVWGREWDDLLARDTDGALLQPHERHARRRLPDVQDRERRLRARELLRPRRARAQRWSRTTPTTRSGTSSAAATTTARSTRRSRRPSEHKGQPTVILAKTIKGYGLGPHFEGRNATHQMKKMTLDDLKHFRDAMHIPITDAQLEENPYLPPYYNPGPQDETIQYLHGASPRARRLPARAPLDPRRPRRCRTTRRTRCRRRARARRRSPPPWRSSAC